MRTLIQGGWVVGFDGRDHQLLPNGVVVYEDDRLLHVGYRFEGPVDRRIDARGKLVSPGLINCHIHADINATHVMLNDATKANYFGMNFLSYRARRRGVRSPRQARVDVEGKFGMWAAARGGATTILDIGTPGPLMDAFADMVGELGVRAYLGPAFRSADYVLDGDGRIQWDWDEAAGEAGLKRACEFIRRYHGAHHDRIRGMLYPGQLDTCTPELLQGVKRAASELGVGIQLHAAMNLVEFHTVLRERQVTSIQYLEQLGFLGPEVILGHCVFHAGHSWAHYPYVDDLQVLADSGVSIAHAPYKYAKMGLALESFERYRRRGINLALGTDTFPEDLIHEMRLAALACRLVEGSFRVGTPHEVYDAATLGGARALGRDDLGRLAPGAKADLIVVDLRQMHFGAVRDPIKSLVECASGRDVEMIVVDGQTLLEDGRPARVDEATLLARVQEASERFWETVPQWRARGATIDEIAPMSYPIRPDGAGC
ncbi:MAG: amidohydrolase family protein [Deltaproteobacteria bacterium]|nr:amidohydrolase family protein [Deltaproteobacteria bacterium]